MLKLLQVSEIVQGKNIRQGLINPITVQERDDGKYEVIAGHRRFEAIKRLGYPHVECNILDDLNEKEIILAQIAENCQRKQMSASELVDTFEDLKERFRMNQAAIAKQFGKSDTWVSNQYQAVRLLASQYGEKVPKAEKKKTAGQIKNDVKKKMAGSELIIAEGMKIQVIGHKYTIFCQTNEAENELRDFIKSHKTGR